MRGYIAVGCACISLVISIISISLPYWYYLQPSIGPVSGGIHFGLWTYCDESTFYLKSESTCESIKTEYLGAVRMLEVIGLLFEAGAALLGALKWWNMKENETLQRLAGGLAILAGLLMESGAIVFAYNVLTASGSGETQALNTLHAGFALAIVSGVAAFFSGGFFFCSKSVNQPQVTPQPAPRNY